MLPLVVTVESKDGSVRRYAFGDSPVRVGRSPFAELQLTEAFVSRWEGTLRFDEREVTYFHVSQTNPTYVDGRAAGVHEEVPIGPTTVLTLGELKLRFERTAVRDEDVRRKGKRQPIKADDETVAKTVWLDASKKLDANIPVQKDAREILASPPAPVAPQFEAPRSRPPAAFESRPPGQASHGSRPPPSYESHPPSRPAEHSPSHPPPPELPAHRSPVANPGSQPPMLSRPAQRSPASDPPRPPSPVASSSVRVAREVRVLPATVITPAQGNVRPDSGSLSQRGVSEQVQSLSRPPGGFVSSRPPDAHPLGERAMPPPDGYAARALERSHSSPPSYDGKAWDSTGSGSGPRLDRNDLEALHAEYRVSWEELCSALGRKLESTPEPQRRQMADHLARRFPAIVQEPEYRALLTRLHLDAPAAASGPSGAPEIAAWLRKIAEGVLPPKFSVDPSATLQRALSLLELLTQSFAEINDAQDNIRRHWLGRAPRSSILRSDNGRAILAYMLNPSADWNERLGEIESAISDVVMHELSLFKATLEGARSLVESMSPEALAKAEGVDLASLEEGGSGSGFLGRLLPRDTPEGRLWRRFMTTYEGLMDGDRYQRLFLGRKFARTYLAAMGQRGDADERDKSGGDR